MKTAVRLAEILGAPLTDTGADEEDAKGEDDEVNPAEEEDEEEDVDGEEDTSTAVDPVSGLILSIRG